MFALRTISRLIALAAPAAAAVLIAGSAAAAPPHPFGGPAWTIGCPNQGSLMSVTGMTGETIAPGVIRFNSFPGAFPMPAAGQVTVAWVNNSNGRAGLAELVGVYPNLSAVVDTGPGEVLATVFGSVSLASGPLCNSTPATGGFAVP